MTILEQNEVHHPEMTCIDCPRSIIYQDGYGENHILCCGTPYEDPVEGMIYPFKESRPIKFGEDQSWECNPDLPKEEWRQERPIPEPRRLNIAKILGRMITRR